MEQKPTLSLFFYAALIALGLLFAWQSIPLFHQSHQQQARRQACPATLIDLRLETVPQPGTGPRHRLSHCLYRYTYQGTPYEGRTFSIFPDGLYARDLPRLVDHLRQKPRVWVSSASPLDAVLTLSPPQSALTGSILALLFICSGLAFLTLWLITRQDRRRATRTWLTTKTLLPDRAAALTAPLLLPAACALGLLLLSFPLVPSFLEVSAFARFTLGSIGTALAVAGLVAGLRWRRARHLALLSISWKPHAGLTLVPPAEAPTKRSELRVHQYQEGRIKRGYRQTGRADFETTPEGLALAPYTFKPVSNLYRPQILLSQTIRVEHQRMLAESEALCQILAGQSSRHKGQSPLMGLMRKTPDHRLTLVLYGRGWSGSYSLPVVFWTSEISR